MEARIVYNRRMSETKVYILHGWSVDSENKKKWQTFISELATYNIQGIFLGIPGLSSPLNEVWNLDNFISWLATELPDNEQVILLGHSFGGQIAARFAARYPDRVKKLILVDSSGIRDHSFMPTMKRSLFLVAAKIGKVLFPFPAFKKILYTLAREKDYTNAPPLLKRTMSSVLDDEVVADLPSITCETLLLWGKQDTVTPLKLGYIFKEKIKNNTLIIIPAARHSPQFTHAGETAKHVAQFVQGTI